MLEILQYILSDISHFIGTIILIITIGLAVGIAIHGVDDCDCDLQDEDDD